VGGGFEFDSDQKTGSDIASMQKQHVKEVSSS
jgi:hypothetical protein